MNLFSLLNLRQLILIVIFHAFFISNANADDSKNLNELLENMQTLSGAFSQKQYLEDGTLISEQAGDFKIHSPGMIRWETIDPMPQLLVSDGQVYWLYDEDLEQVTTGIVDESTSTLMVLFSGGADKSSLQENYNVELLQELTDSEFQAPSDNQTLFRVTPKQQQAMVSFFDVSFSDGVIESINVNDPMGQLTTFNFDQIEMNQPIAKDYFAFSPPPDVDVIQQ